MAHKQVTTLQREKQLEAKPTTLYHAGQKGVWPAWYGPGMPEMGEVQIQLWN